MASRGRPRKGTDSDTRREAIMAALRDGRKSQSDIAKEFGVTRQAVSYIAKQLVETDTTRAIVASSEEDDLIGTDREWLAKIRDDPNAPYGERVKCGIALARMSAAERAKDDDWKPPVGDDTFAEALAMAISELGQEARERVRTLLAPE